MHVESCYSVEHINFWDCTIDYCIRGGHCNQVASLPDGEGYIEDQVLYDCQNLLWSNAEIDPWRNRNSHDAAPSIFAARADNNHRSTAPNGNRQCQVWGQESQSLRHLWSWSSCGLVRSTFRCFRQGQKPSERIQDHAVLVNGWRRDLQMTTPYNE